MHFLEAIEAEDGASAVNWHAQRKSHLHGSPFPYNVDKDGVLDIGVGTFNGQTQFFKDTVLFEFCWTNQNSCRRERG